MSGTQKFKLQDQIDLQKFVSDVIDGESKAGAILDSASAASAVLTSANSAKMPAILSEAIGMAADEKQESAIVKAIFDGVENFQREHGFRPTGDLLLSALHQGRMVLDSATNGHHDQISLTPNAPVVAILGALVEATPFAGYLPADKGSNEARLIIVSHQAGSDWGDYSANDLMDGVKSGGSYLGSSRTQELAAPNDTLAYKFLFTAQAAAGAALKLLRGRAIVYVNGRIVAQETGNASSALATVSIGGSIRLGSTDYSLAGTVKPATGEVSVTPTPAFPAGTVVTSEVFVDYEQDSSVTPRMAVNASVYSLFASPFRAIYQITPESRSQFANEVGVDAGAEAMMAVRGQYATERHYNALKKAKMIGKFANPQTYDFGYANQILQKTRAQIWQDFQAVCGVADQVMAELTADHGGTHMYVTKQVMAQFQSMPRDLFEPSGITARPGIYRVGKLFGKYDVYFTPKVLNEAADGSSAEILLVGRSSQTARCPIIFGDASAPVFEQLGTGTDMKSGYGFNARSFTAVNPHDMSSLGAALITVTNLK